MPNQVNRTFNKKSQSIKRKVAFFDVDGTIFRSSLLIEITEKLIEKRYFPESIRERYMSAQKRWLDREGDYADYIKAVVGVFVEQIKGLPYSHFADTAKEVVTSEQKKVYRYTRDLIKELRKKNYFLLAISQSPKTILDPFCRILGFDKVYGRIFELGPSESITGNFIDEYLIENKANIVRRAIEKERLSLKGSIAVGDTEDDIPMLELVERPICFNPNRKLYKWAKRNQAEIVVERKDVIYKL
ncbi:MAG TPA: HAD-IB family hydrolase [Candidatus Paceibacterota bacterium]